MPTDNDKLVEKMADEYVRQVERLTKAIGDKPMFGGKKLSRQEQLAEYAQMRDSVEAWTAFIEEHGPTGARQYAAEMERMMRSGESEADASTRAGEQGGEDDGRP